MRKYTDAQLVKAIIVALQEQKRRIPGIRLAQFHDLLFDSDTTIATGGTLQWNLDRIQLNRALQALRKADKIFYFSPPVGWRLKGPEHV